MNTRRTTLRFAVIVAVPIVIGMLSCQPENNREQQKEHDQTSTPSKDTVSNQPIKPSVNGYADVNGLKMYYEVYGEGKPIVLIHGAFMTIPMNWSNVIPVLAKDHKVIVAEMQGHGRTKDIAREMSCEGMANDVSGLLKMLKIDSADILGYSMGGSVAFQFAVRHPEQLRRLVILSSSYAHNGWWPEAQAAFKNVNADAFKGSPIQKQYDSMGNDPAKFDDYIKRVMSMDGDSYDWSKDVKKIQAPIFMAIGDADGIRYEHALELFRAKGGGKMGDMTGLPKSRLAILPGTTHVGMVMQRTNLWIPMVIDFLDSDLDAPLPTF